MKMIKVTPLVKSVYPKAKFGLLFVKGVNPAPGQSAINDLINTEINGIKLKYPGYERSTVLATEPLCHYAAYYRQFKKSYHVLGQLESVLLKGKSISSVCKAVDVMFLAEIKNLLLTAGHDLDSVEGNLTIDVAAEPISYKTMSEKDQQLVNNDLYLKDEKGVLSSILFGPDHRTRINETTKNVLYFVYGVEGVTEQLIQEHLKTIFSYLSQTIHGVEMQSMEII
jgi:DNA/RNA-binding domain of Phe-tRNA-synthetase-like protein